MAEHFETVAESLHRVANSVQMALVNDTVRSLDLHRTAFFAGPDTALDDLSARYDELQDRIGTLTGQAKTEFVNLSAIHRPGR